MFIMNLSFNHFAIIKSNHYRYCIRYDIPRILTHAMWANVCVCLIISIWSYIPAHSLFYNDFVIGGGGGVVRAHARHQNSMLSVLFSFFSLFCWLLDLFQFQIIHGYRRALFSVYLLLISISLSRMFFLFII